MLNLRLQLNKLLSLESILILICVFCSINLLGQGLQPGVIASDESGLSDGNSLGFAGFGESMLEPFHDDVDLELLTISSLDQYVPKNGSQGVSSTSVGWAVAYMAGSMAWNIKHDITDDMEKALYVFDPIYPLLMAKATEEDYYCDSPVTFEEIFEAIKKAGLKRALDFPFIACTDLSAPEVHDSYPARLDNWRNIPLDLSPLKSFHASLQSGRPVVVGVKLTAEFLDQSALNDGIWQHNNDHLFLDYQAMVLTGLVKKQDHFFLELQTNYGLDFSTEGRVLLPVTIAHELLFAAYALEFSFDETYDRSSVDFEGIELDFNRRSHQIHSVEITVKKEDSESRYELDDEDGLILIESTKNEEMVDEEIEMLINQLIQMNVFISH